MNWKRLGNKLLFPPVALMIVLIPVATVLLVGAMVFIGSESPIAILSYVLAAYTLTVWCMKTPELIHFFKDFKNGNKYAKRWMDDARWRVNLSLYGSFGWNTLYGLFQLWLGFYHHTFWFYSLGAYYICLAAMRFSLARYTRKYRPGEHMEMELKRYRACGWVFLVMNLALSLIVFFMLYWNRTFHHHMITAIAMAAYTFTAFTIAIVNVVKYRTYQSPVFSASKAISFAAACVSMLTLTSTLLTTFSDESMGATEQKIMLGSVGIAVSAVVVLMAFFMIVHGNKKLKQRKWETHNGTKKA
ncbi:MAG: hypothetical protein IKA76_04175 [Clostridia bacterium]|nr:hypothetical protein [Clostridia bacterium]